MRKMLLLSIGIVVCMTPIAVSYAALVPCEGVECQSCHVVTLVQNIVNWFFKVMVPICSLIVAFAGIKMVMAGGDMGAIKEARSMMTNVLIGFAIILSAWLIVDTVMKTFVNNELIGDAGSTESQSKYGPWNAIKCVAQPTYRQIAENEGRPVVGGGTGTLNAAQVQSRITTSSQYRSQLCAIASENGLPANQCDSLQALLAIESNGNAGATSPVGAAGLMQLMPGTAKTLDPSLANLTDDQIRERLKDPTYNMQMGTKYYASLYRQYNGDLAKTYAAYNGGPGANNPSRDCPGMMRWQCEWDDAAHTVPNTGYRETRNYVNNVRAVRCAINSTGC